MGTTGLVIAGSRSARMHAAEVVVTRNAEMRLHRVPHITDISFSGFERARLQPSRTKPSTIAALAAEGVSTSHHEQVEVVSRTSGTAYQFLAELRRFRLASVLALPWNRGLMRNHAGLKCGPYMSLCPRAIRAKKVA